jgi:hypothetical protein
MIMGMFDRVMFSCPNRGCTEALEAQSKVGSCTGANFWADKVPMKIAKDIIGRSLYCGLCNQSFKIRVAPQDEPTLELRLER